MRERERDEPSMRPSSGPWPGQNHADYPASWWIRKRTVEGEKKKKVVTGGERGNWRMETGGGEKGKEEKKKEK